MATQRQQGEFIQADFFDNKDGLNITDSPFVVKPSQATAGYNYEYSQTGGIRKRNGHTLLNSTPNTQARSLCFFLYNTTLGVKTLIRAAGTKLQVTNQSTGATTNLTDDIASPASNFFTSNVSVNASQFNTPSVNLAWFTGGGLASGTVLGYNGTKCTTNGSVAPTGSVSASAAGVDGTLPAGTYYYAVALHKLSTGAISNAALDVSVSVGATNHVTIDFTGITGLDVTKYDLFYIYRSVISGASSFTTGDLAGTCSTGVSTFKDTGTVQLTANPVPRAGSTSLDNSILPAGTYNVSTVWKRRLVTAVGSTVYISDLNKSESWPTFNTISIPTGGQITALGIISFISSSSSTTDELLVIFKENELWTISGTSISDWALKFVDYVGCVNQSLLVFANGFLFWIDYRGVYIFDGANKPVYCSRLIEYDFSDDGDIDMQYLSVGVGSFFKKQNQVIWYLSSATLGFQVLSLKMDLRLTLPGYADALYGRILDGIFIKDYLSYNVTAAQATFPNYDEAFFAGGTDGYIWKLFANPNSDNGSAINFSYRTRSEDFGLVATTKRFHKVVVWCRQSTINNITLRYWVSYQTDAAHYAQAVQQVSTQVTNAYWDQATWDAAYWDQSLITYTPVVFNLGNPTIGVEGDALTLEFRQTDVNSPIIIAGYSVIYSVAGMRK